jgi:TPR repeat protein
MSQQKFDVFISYSRKDTAIADQICEAFDKHGITYFIDRQGIGGGLEFPDVLADAICDSGIFLYLASNNSYDSKFTKSEVTFAFNEKPHNSILPYIIDGSTPPRGIRFTFASINWRNIQDHPIEPTLVKDVCGLLGKTDIPQTSTTIPANEICQLGHKYYNEENYTEAANLYRKAADKGNSIAQFSLGVCYFNGAGVEQNFTEATKWFRKAADQGDADAQYWLGYCYEYRRGIELNYIEAAKWYRKAANQGHDAAKKKLGWCLENATDSVQLYQLGKKAYHELNDPEAAKWYRKAAEQGNADAQYELGCCYYSGRGVEQNYTEAVKWYRKAADQGHARAQCDLGGRYEYGKGVEKNFSEAAKWYRKAAEQGDSRAQYNLGLCYANGRGVEKDSSEAVKWYRKAAEQGDAGAQKALERLGYKR